MSEPFTWAIDLGTSIFRVKKILTLMKESKNTRESDKILLYWIKCYQHTLTCSKSVSASTMVWNQHILQKNGVPDNYARSLKDFFQLWQLPLGHNQRKYLHSANKEFEELKTAVRDCAYGFDSSTQKRMSKRTCRLIKLCTDKRRRTHTGVCNKYNKTWT